MIPPIISEIIERYNMFKLNKLLEANIFVIGGYPVKGYLLIGASLGALVAWILMAAIFAIF
tara:strand:- start:134 stop:316 length:183 start_codon:yes stop_codon:yes gene_type:complete